MAVRALRRMLSVFETRRLPTVSVSGRRKRPAPWRTFTLTVFAFLPTLTGFLRPAPESLPLPFAATLTLIFVSPPVSGASGALSVVNFGLVAAVAAAAGQQRQHGSSQGEAGGGYASHRFVVHRHRDDSTLTNPR